MGTRSESDLSAGTEVGEKNLFRESRVHGQGYQTAPLAEEPALALLPSFSVFYFLGVNTVPGGRLTC